MCEAESEFWLWIFHVSMLQELKQADTVSYLKEKFKCFITVTRFIFETTLVTEASFST